MADGFEVELDELGTTAREVRAAADALAGLRPEQALARLAGAMPDSLTAEAAAVLADVWSRRLRRATESAVDLADGLTAAVASYQQVDDRVGGRLRGHADLPRAS